MPDEFLYMLVGLLVGILVGLTGVGGRSPTTPILVLLFGQSPTMRWEPISCLPRRPRPSLRPHSATGDGSIGRLRVDSRSEAYRRPRPQSHGSGCGGPGRRSIRWSPDVSP